MMLIHHSHDIQIFLLFSGGFVIERSTLYFKQTTLLAYTERLLLSNAFYQFCSHRPNFFETFFKKSRSISSWPILAYSLSKSTWDCFSGDGVSKISDARSVNSCFHFEIMFGCTSNLFESSANDSRSLSASIATCALKAPENFLLLVFIFHCKVKFLFFNLTSGSNFGEYYSTSQVPSI